MPHPLHIKIATTKPEIQNIFDIRRKVFVQEQGFTEEEEFDEYDDSAEASTEHVIVNYRGKAIGCARVRWVEDKIQLERIALLKPYRGKGFGKEIVEFMVDYAKKQNPKEIYANTQLSLYDFYIKLGFKPRGKVFKECCIDHIRMYLEVWGG